ncbi:MAG TPA: ATP-binding protein [Chloroflexota bacterium]|nr:ATP-binding protein [Chloroflexota bacterium]
MHWSRVSLSTKLLVSYLFVIVVGAVTLIVAADAVAPSFLAAHEAQMAGGAGMRAMMARAGILAVAAELEDAFRAAMYQALYVATAAAALVALAASLFVSRQIARPLRRMAAATGRIAAGHYAERVAISKTNLGDELGQLAASFNSMADALEQTERRRLELIGDVAHELRTPIATLEGYLEGLLDGVVEPTTETWAQLHDEAGRLRRLVDDLQELSRAEAHQIPLSPRPVSPALIVDTAYDRLAPAFAEKGLDFHRTVDRDLPLVRTDSDRAVQVLTNLLTNALRYTSAPGQVELRAERLGDAVAIRVRDTGLGLTTEQCAQIFERFYRVDKSRSRALGGTGIGLTIARSLVDAMGGRIWAESPGPGQGSTFSFTLPRA